MAKITLKKSLQVVLENSKQVLIKVISESMMLQTSTESEVAWLLLEFTLEYPFPPTIALAQKHEIYSYVNIEEHPLLCYNAADVELFSENGNIILDFDAYEDLFETVDELIEEIEYDDRQPFMFQLYVDVCKALMLESVKWTHLTLAPDFHVTARDYEICNEAVYLKKLLPRKAFNKIQRKIDMYDAIINDIYKNDETVVKVNAVLEVEAQRYDALLATLDLDACTDVFSMEEIYFLKPFHVEMHMHKRVHEIERDLSTLKPADTSRYFHYKFSNNIPQMVDYYHDGVIIWRKIFQHTTDTTSYHMFYLKSGSPEFENYAFLKQLPDSTILYEKYSDGYYDEVIYYKNDQDLISRSIYFRSMFGVGHKMDATFEYIFEYKRDDLFKISCLKPDGQQKVSYCKDDSFMDEAIDAYVNQLCSYTIGKMKTQSLENLEAVVFVYDISLAFYLNVNLVLNKIMFDITTYQQFENDSSMMNLNLYVAESSSATDTEYFSREKAEAYVERVYTELCSTLSERIQEQFQIHVPVVVKYIHDDLEL